MWSENKSQYWNSWHGFSLLYILSVFALYLLMYSHIFQTTEVDTAVSKHMRIAHGITGVSGGCSISVPSFVYATLQFNHLTLNHF